MYVGTIFPGENSLISRIKIFHSINKEDEKNTISINSKILSKGFPIINNYLKFKDYEVNFETIIRPTVRNKE